MTGGIHTEERSRRQEYAEATRDALLDSARSLFATQGFAATSLDQVAQDARVTKGAVYHHFAHKQALFEAVLDQLDERAVAIVLAAAQDAPCAWSGLDCGLRAFLDQCLDPLYQRICFIEGPTALGFEYWWSCGEKHQISVIRAVLTALSAESLLEVDDIEMLAELLFGAMAAAALSIARAEDPKEMVERIHAVASRMVWGLRPPSAMGDG